MGIMPAQAKSAVEIHRRLAQGQPDDVIARAVTRKPRVIRNHRSWRCQCNVDRPTPESRPTPVPELEAVAVELEAAPMVAPVDVDDPQAVATMAYLAGVSLLGIASALGVDVAVLDADIPDFGLAGLDISRRRLGRLGARADALEKMRLFRPAQWAKLIDLEAESERKAAFDSRLPRETWVGFFSEIVHHQAGLLTADDFQLWREWDSRFGDFTVSRHGEVTTVVMQILAPWVAKFGLDAIPGSDEARRFDLESENARLRRRLADVMLTADADTLEGLSRLIHLQALARHGRDDSNESTVIDC